MEALARLWWTMLGHAIVIVSLLLIAGSVGGLL